MSISWTITDIFSVEYWRDLEIYVRGRIVSYQWGAGLDQPRRPRPL